jgi:hypothetical protein
VGLPVSLGLRKIFLNIKKSNMATVAWFCSTPVAIPQTHFEFLLHYLSKLHCNYGEKFDVGKWFSWENHIIKYYFLQCSGTTYLPTTPTCDVGPQNSLSLHSEVKERQFCLLDYVWNSDHIWAVYTHHIHSKVSVTNLLLSNSVNLSQFSWPSSVPPVHKSP